MRTTLLLPLLFGACASTAPRPAAAPTADPPARALYAIPFAPARPGPFLDERAAFDAALSIYRDHGLAEPVTLDLSEDVVLPYAGEGTVHLWRFLGEGPAPGAHVDQVSRLFYGGRLGNWRQHFASPAAATRALQGFMLATLGHEIAHVLAASRGVNAYTTDPWREETRAIHFEWAVLRELVQRGLVPPETLADAAAFDRMLLAGAPQAIVGHLPTSEAERRARFNAAYPFAATGDVVGHEAEVDLVLALYSQVRLELYAAPPESWDTLLPMLAPPPPDPTPMASAAAAFLQRPDLPFDRTPGGIDASRHLAYLADSSRTVALELTPIERTDKLPGSIALEVRHTLPHRLDATKRRALAVLLGRANREHTRLVCDVTDPEPLIRCRAWVASAAVNDPLDNALIRASATALRFFMRWQAAIDLVLDKRANPDTVAPVDVPEVP